MSARLLSFVIWALVAASAVFWAQRLVSRSTPVPVNARLAGAAPVPAAPLTRLFGAAQEEPDAPEVAPAPAPADPRFKLIGVAAPRPGQRAGLALISVDEGPARALRIGARVDGSWIVQSIGHRQVDIGPPGGPAAVSLTLDALPEASRGPPPSPPVLAPIRPPAPVLPAPPPPPPAQPGQLPGVQRMSPPVLRPNFPATVPALPGAVPPAMQQMPPVSTPFGAGAPGAAPPLVQQPLPQQGQTDPER